MRKRIRFIFVLLGFVFFNNCSVFSIRINWETTDREEIVRQWKDVFWLKPMTEEQIDELVYIAKEIIRCNQVEQEYLRRAVFFPVKVIFPGNVLVECSAEEFGLIEDRVVPTPAENTFVLVDSSWFGFSIFSSKSVLAREGDYSASGDCVMNPEMEYNYRKSSWALKGIDYNSLGFFAFNPRLELGGLCVSRTIWMTPHHYRFSVGALKTQMKYTNILFQRQQELAMP